MKKGKSIIILGMLIIMVLLFLSAFYVAAKGAFDLNFLGIRYIDWYFTILDLVIISIILYDFISIRVKRKKYGELKYILKTVSKPTQVIGLILIIIIFIFELIINLIVLNNNIKFMNGSLLFMFGMMALNYGYHILEKEGLAEQCVYLGGTPIKWSNVTNYDLCNSVLTLNITRKIFLIKEKINIHFIVSIQNEKDIVEFVKKRAKIDENI